MNALLLLAIAAASAATIPDPIELAFANMRDHQAAQCGFSRMFHDGDTSTIERFDPESGAWALLEIDGHVPDAKALKKYSKDRKKRVSRTLPTNLDFDDLAIAGSYKWVEDSDPMAVYEFTPAAASDDDKAITEALIGKLVVNKDQRSVTYFEISNVEPFSPQVGVKVNSMYQKIVYRWLEDQQVFVIGAVAINMQGKAFGLKKISQDVEVTYADFSCVQY